MRNLGRFVLIVISIVHIILLSLHHNTPTPDAIASLCYIYNAIYEKVQQCNRKICMEKQKLMQNTIEQHLSWI